MLCGACICRSGRAIACAGTVNAQMAQQGGLAQGVYLYAVDPGGAAAAAGLQVGDVITRIDGMEIRTMTDLSAAKKSYTAGDTARFTVVRGGQSLQITVTWGGGAGSRRIRFPKRTGTGARRLRPIWGPVRPYAVLRRVSGHRHAAGGRSPAVCFTDSLTAVSGLFNPPIYTEHRKTRIRPVERGITIL